MNNLDTHISDINKCLQAIIDIFKLPEITIHFELLDNPGDIDNYNLNSKVKDPVLTQVVYRYQSFGDLPSPSRYFYTFKGWYLNFEKDDISGSSWSNEITDYSKVLLPGNTVKLYAKWVLNTYTIKLNPGSGTVYPTSVKCKLFDNLSNALSVLQNGGPTKANASFTGWTDNFGNRLTPNTLLSTGVNTLYASFSEGKYTLTFNYNYTGDVSKSTNSNLPDKIPDIQNGESINLVSYDNDGDDDNNINLITEGSALTRPGFRFKGWSLLKNNPDTQFVVYIYENTTLYASWEPLTYNIEYKYANNVNLTPLSCQVVEYDTIATLISYKTLFCIDAPNNFTWYLNGSDRFDDSTDNNVYKFKDADLVEDLVSTNNGTVTFYPFNNTNDSQPWTEYNANTVTNNNVKAYTTKISGYNVGDIFYGLDFNMQFINGKIRHPSKIDPSAFYANLTEVTCYYSDKISAIANVSANQEIKLQNVSFNTSNIKTTYNYGDRLDLDELYVTETYSNGSQQTVKYKNFPQQFFTYPDEMTYLTGKTTVYFGYRSAFDGSIWPNDSENKAMWDNTATSKEITVRQTGRQIIIQRKPKTNYIEGNTLNIDSLILAVKSANGDVIIYNNPDDISEKFTFVPSLNVPLNTNNSSVTIKLKDDQAISTSFNIVVQLKKPTSFKIKLPTSLPSSLYFASSYRTFSAVSAAILSSNDISAEIKYNNNSNTPITYKFSNISTDLTIDPIDEFGSTYGEINTKVNYTCNNVTLSYPFTIKKRYPNTLLIAVINKDSKNTLRYRLENIKNTNNSPFAVECYYYPKDIDNTKTGGPYLSAVIFAKLQSDNTYAISQNDTVPLGTTRIYITSTNNDKTALIFDRNIMDKFPTVGYANRYIYQIQKCVPPFTYYNSTLTSTNLYSVSDPEKYSTDFDVTFIASSAFYNDERIQNIDIPSSVASIGEDAFSGCRNISSVTFNANTPPIMYASTFGTNSNNFTGYNRGGRWFVVPKRFKKISYKIKNENKTYNCPISVFYKNNVIIDSCLNRSNFPFKLSVQTK